MNNLKWWRSACLAMALVAPAGLVQAADTEDARWDQHDEHSAKHRDEYRKDKSSKSQKSTKSGKSGKSGKSKGDRHDEPEIKLKNVRYQADENRLKLNGKLDDFDGDSTGLTIADAAFGTELASLEVRKNFNLKIELAEGQPVPCAVIVTAGGISVTEPVRKAPDTCGKFSTVLTGLVTDGPIPFATVSVTLDGVTYTTTADENGFYALEIFSTTVKKLVKVEASGSDPETGTPIDFVSFAGSFERLIDGEPENVTNVTTASYALALEANGGAEPETLEQLQAAETAIDATELFELAAVIKLIVDNPNYALPAGFDSILDFIADGTAVDTFVAAADPQDLADTVAEILADSDLVAGFDAGDIPARYFAIPTANPGFLARQGEILEFDQATGTGVILSFAAPSGQSIEESFSWTVDGGRLELVYDSPVTTISFPGVNTDIATQEQIDLLAANGIFQVDQVRETTQSVYTRVTAGTLVDVVAVEEIVEISYPPIDVIDPDTGLTVTVQLAGSTEFSNGTDTLRSDANIQPTPLVADCVAAAADEICVPGRWGGVYRYSAGEQFGFVFPTTSYGEVITFDPTGTASGVISGAGSSWSVVDGSLVINYPDGAQQKVTLLDSLGIEYGALSEYTTPEGRFASYNIWVKADTSFEFTEPYLQTAAGAYWQGDVNTWIPGNIDENGQRPLSVFFGWTFDAAPDPNQGENLFRLFFDEDGDGFEDNVLARRPNTWELQPGRVRIDRFLAGPGQGRVRYWYPIASLTDGGDRVFYVMETEVFEFPGLGEQMFIVPRLNIERELAIPVFDAEIFVNVP